MTQIPPVISDQVIASTWGNTIRDQTVQVFASTAERDAAISAPFAGQTVSVAGRPVMYTGTEWRCISVHDITTAGISSMNPITPAGHTLISSAQTVTPSRPGAVLARVEFAMTLHALDTAQSTWTYEIQGPVGGTLVPAFYATFTTNQGGAIAIAAARTIKLAAGTAGIQIVIRRTAGTGATQCFGQANSCTLAT